MKKQRLQNNELKSCEVFDTIKTFRKMTIKALIYKELDTDEKFLVDTKIFDNVVGVQDHKVQDWEYETILDYADTYNLADWENSPAFYIEYVDSENKLMCSIDMLESFFNL